MGYATKDDMIKRFSEQELIELTDRDNLGVVDESVLAQAIEDASAKIDAYISSRYELPLSAIPAVLVPTCCDMARYYLYDDAASEQVANRYEDALSYLKDVSKGQIKLSGSASSGESRSNNLATIESDGRNFGRTNAKGFI